MNPQCVIPAVAVSFQLLACGDMAPVGRILPPSLLHQPELPPTRAVQPQRLAAEMRQEKSPPPCSGWSGVSVATSPEPRCHRQLKVIRLGTLPLHEVDVSPALGLMEASGTCFSLPASG